MGKDEIFKFELECLVMDSQAKCEAMHTNGVTGYSACPRCPQVGCYEDGARSMQFASIRWIPLRTDESFRCRLDPRHHTPDSRTAIIALERLPNFDIVEQTVIEPMHNSDCGCVKKMLCCLLNVNKNQMMSEFKLTKNQLEKLNERYEEAKSYFPKEFQRKSRSLTFIEKFKCSEFRSIILYCNYFLLNGIVDDKVLNHFMLYSVAIRLLADEIFVKNDSNINIAQHLLDDCVQILNRSTVKESHMYITWFCIFMRMQEDLEVSIGTPHILLNQKLVS